MLAVDLLHELDDLLARRGVQVGRRLVRQHDLRLGHQGARDGDALPLAAGELVGLVVAPLLEADLRDEEVDPLAPLALRPSAVPRSRGNSMFS